MSDEQVNVCKPIYGHTSEETAHVVSDYPYGSLRTTMKFWLEGNDKGFRLVMRSINPKNGRLNAPKKSTYSEIAGCMYLDEKDHCHWDGVSIYTEAPKVVSFIERFPQTSQAKLLPWVLLKVAMYRKVLDSGMAMFKVNGVAAPMSDVEREDYTASLKGWEAALEALKANKPATT